MSSREIVVALLAFVAGAAFERTRPQVAVGRGTAVLTGLCVAGAGAALLLPQRTEPPGHGPGPVRGKDTRPATGALPNVRFRPGRPGEVVRVDGATFRVVLAQEESWARQIRRGRAGRGLRWVTVAVRATNLHRPRFAPTRLTYRLQDGRGNSYGPESQGGVAPRAFSRRGTLLRGESVRVQLSFRVPAKARRVTLVFEDRELGSTQVRVPLR